MPFRSETEAIREQIRRLEEEASELDLERAALTRALELKSPRRHWVGLLFVTALVALALGWAAGARLCANQLAAELALLQRLNATEQFSLRNPQRACESDNAALSAELSSCLAQLNQRPLPPQEPCRCVGSDPRCECPFDRGAAASALRSVDVHPCFVPPRPATFHARMTFEGKGGVVQTAAFDSGDLSEPEKRCVQAALRRVKVPAFGGGAVTVGKSFTVGGLR